MNLPRAAAAMVLPGAVAVLVACTVLAPQPRLTRLPSDAPESQTSLSASPSAVPEGTPLPIPGPEAAGGCDGRPVVLTAGSPTLTISGDCPDVQVQGTDLAIDARAASVQTLLIAGDRVSVRAGGVGTLTIRGNDTVVSAAGIDALVVNGDRNAVVAAGGVDSVVVQGNDNTVRGSVDRISDQGGRNSVG